MKSVTTLVLSLSVLLWLLDIGGSFLEASRHRFNVIMMNLEQLPCILISDNISIYNIANKCRDP